MNSIVIALVLVQVTMVDGAKVFFNPEFVVKVYPTKESQGTPNTLVTKGARCVITLSDGKFLSVVEPCEYVLSLVEGKQLRRR